MAARWIGLLVAVIAAVSVKISCTSTVQVGAGPPSVTVHSTVVVASGGYAAMDEVPVAGGELRLAVPQVAVVGGVERERSASRSGTPRSPRGSAA